MTTTLLVWIVILGGFHGAPAQDAAFSDLGKCSDRALQLWDSPLTKGQIPYCMPVAVTVDTH